MAARNVLGTVALFVVAGAGSASAEPVLTRVISPGNEAAIAAMVGMDAELPESCRLDGVQIDRTYIAATYRCPSSAPRVELRHATDPAVAGAALRTERFALVVTGNAPPGLIDQLVRDVRAHEGDFHWTTVESAGDPVRRSSPPPPSLNVAPFFAQSSSFASGVLGIAAVASIAYGARMARGRRA
jgi:hypothetical protein